MFSRFTQRSLILVKHVQKNQKYNASIKVNSNSEHSLPFKIILGTIPVITFGLGTWQVYRLKWKLNLIEKLQNQTNEPPIDLPKDIRNLEELEYRKVKVKGRFDHSKEIIIKPRSFISNDLEETGGILSDPRKSGSGAWVITPFILSDRNYSILVNRGWVPKEKINPKARKEGQILEEHTLVGVVRKTEKRAQFGMKNNVQKGQWNYRDIETMSQSTNSAPVFIDAVKESSIPGGPIGGQTRINLRNDHLSYLFTWYSLSAITSFMTYKVFRKR